MPETWSAVQNRCPTVGPGRRRAPRAATAALLAAALLASPPRSPAAQARLTLTDGLEMRGDVTLLDDRVVLRNSAGKVILRRERVATIDWLEPSATPDEEYARRTFALKDDDSAGRLAIAQWALSQGRAEWARRHCEHVLRGEPDNSEALRLLSAAAGAASQPATSRQAGDRAPSPETKPAPRRPAQRAAGTPPSAPPEAPGSRRERRLDDGPARPALLSDRDINRLKLHEIDPHGPVQDVNVRFRRVRGSRDVDEAVLDELRAKPDADRAALRILERGKAHEKLHVILQQTGMTYADRIDVRGDTPVFARFRRAVLPEVLKGCARAGCHAGDVSYDFRFPVGSTTNEKFVYTSFLILSEMDTPAGRMIDRALPEESALLKYMLADESGASAHPDVKSGRFQPPYRSEDNRHYRDIVEWIASLRIPQPEYALDYEPPAWLERTVSSQPAASEP